MMHKINFLAAIAILFSLIALSHAQDIPDFTRGDKVPEGHNHDWNLGPTGARGWIYSNRLETTQARQILITKVDAKSPADEVLKQGDVILGCAGADFSTDPRKELGKAIGVAEANDGSLKLLRFRNGETENVTVKLAAIGKYAHTAPFDCSKSKHIFEQGCRALAQRMNVDPSGGDKIVRALNTLALLSSGNEDYMPLIKQQVKWAAQYSDPQGRELCCWYYGPINMLLAEYTIATGDQTYVDDMKRITMDIVNGQSAVGSWGHRFSRPDGRLNGYGMMNAPGLPMTTSLVLARKAGISDPKLDEAIRKSTLLMRFYVGKGSVPYGDHSPWMETHDDNGKNGIAALMFNLLNDSQAATYFSKMSTASHGNDRELGHTGNFFNLLWALPGVALSGPSASGQWMQEYGWYYDLARKWDGTFQHQGPAQPKSDRYKNWDSTGAYLLGYGQQLRKLQITGAVQGVVPKMSAIDASNVVAAGRGYSHRNKKSIYGDRSVEELFESLQSWSPVVRQRAAASLSKRKGNFKSQLNKLLKSDDLFAKLGGCQAVAALGKRASATVPQLRMLLAADDFWLRINAAEALASIGDEARVAVPDLLKMLSQIDAEDDPRGMQQRYLCVALFDKRNGLLKRSLDGVDRDSLYAAVRAGLQNQDGRARGTIASVYNNLSFQEIEPLLPAIHHAVVESAPSGMMFADGIRMSGLELMAKLKIEEGMQLCIDLMELDRWGLGKRIPRCLVALQQYGSAAKSIAPGLDQLKQYFAKKRNLNEKHKEQLKLIDQTLQIITADTPPPKLRTLSSGVE